MLTVLQSNSVQGMARTGGSLVSMGHKEMGRKLNFCRSFGIFVRHVMGHGLWSGISI
uniref:Uncharacterized protein n=1 Tax=Arundo donax TaxID=35708 RepID=A0A0A9A5E2_ARUDO